MFKKNGLDYKVIQSFSDEPQVLILECQRMIDDFYDSEGYEERLKSGVIFPATLSGNRLSYAFTVGIGNEDDASSECVHINDLPTGIKNLTRDVVETLNVNKGFVIINFQFYQNGCDPVPEHFDGNYLDWNMDNGKMIVKKAIRPEKVAILTLENQSNLSGTNIHSQKDKICIRCKAGTLLLFNNLTQTHSVDSIVDCEHTELNQFCRITMGWRSISQNCWLWADEKISMATEDEIKDLSTLRKLKINNNSTAPF